MFAKHTPTTAGNVLGLERFDQNMIRMTSIFSKFQSVFIDHGALQKFSLTIAGMMKPTTLYFNGLASPQRNNWMGMQK